jgi:hypothetical protein
MGAGEEQLQDGGIMGFWKKTVKHGDCALPSKSGQISREGVSRPTWRRSSKSLAAIFFSSDTFALNFLIVSRPNVGTCLNLGKKLCKHLAYGLFGHEPLCLPTIEFMN